MRLEGKTVLVTGAAKRVGRAIALAFAEKGANIILHYHRSGQEAENTRKEIEALGVTCRLAQANLAEIPAIEKMAGEIYRGSSVDILVNSASLFYATPLETVREPDWDRLIDANLKGPFFLSKEVGTRMAKDRGGKIVNLADWSGFRPYKNYAPYCVSKGGLLTLTKALARDLAPKVQVNAVAPGPVLPPPDMTDEEREKVVKKTPLGRWGTPEDVAYAVRFLAENDFINGTVLVVDGGRSLV